MPANPPAPPPPNAYYVSRIYLNLGQSGIFIDENGSCFLLSKGDVLRKGYRDLPTFFEFNDALKAHVARSMAASPASHAGVAPVRNEQEQAELHRLA